ncbi:phosphomannomutase/phosphoglucomutase [candidate division WOR-3 bacterium]|uniref:Phosphomannomutase/phosphoglucomutase n=1 Tax=candidate division WOR-3 bacterium TaxID=2052148 RepID=A0A937XDY5_UNCW3|nr:phosphomannomutase/phosphoglucomutase [candidate division WOR-3 bacterium]
MNPLIFREYDIRGIAETELPDDEVHRLGQAFGTYALEHGATFCPVGRDVRLSGPRIQKALVDGLLSTGLDVTDIGVVPTPVFYFSQFFLDSRAGIMVTASHNPPPYNGFKVGLAKTTIHGEEIQLLRRLMESGRFRQGKGTLGSKDVVPAYIEMVRSKVSISRPLRVGFDPGNGCAGVLIERLFSGTRIEPEYINLQPDGNFPAHVPDPTVPKYMKQLADLVLAGGFDCGIGYDGDSDRIGAIDDKGKSVYGDRLLGICAAEVIKKHPGAKIVFEVKCSQALVEYLERIGGTPLMWKTGHSLIKAKMKEEGALLAGEMSGHMFFADDYYGYDDALFASLRLLSIIASTGRKLSDLAAEMPSYPTTPELRASCPEELKFRIVGEVRDYFRGKYPVIDIDGARVVFPDGWGLIRASNTQAVLVLRFEAKTKERLAEIQKLFYDQLAKYPQVKLPE